MTKRAVRACVHLSVGIALIVLLVLRVCERARSLAIENASSAALSESKPSLPLEFTRLLRTVELGSDVFTIPSVQPVARTPASDTSNSIDPCSNPSDYASSQEREWTTDGDTILIPRTE